MLFASLFAAEVLLENDQWRGPRNSIGTLPYSCCFENCEDREICSA